jgi:hypothetical protein
MRDVLHSATTAGTYAIGEQHRQLRELDLQLA